MGHSLALFLQQQMPQSDQTYQPVYSQPTYVDNTSIWSHMTDALQQSVYRVVSLLVSILPGLLALIIALAVLTGIGILLSWALRRTLTALKFDDRFARSQTTGVADWSPSHSPTALVGRIAFWGCVLLGLIVGVSAFDASYATGTALPFSFLPYFTHAIGALFLLFIGNLIARFLARSILIGAVNAQLQYARFLSLGVKWLVLVLTAAMVLDHLQIGGTVVELAFGILFGGIVLTLSLAVGLGSRDIVSRSLERTVDSKPEPIHPSAPSQETPEPLRHF
ncbi:hypothetical protein [Granulicella arctica]|uniref:Uncharacterized protein n=1 Tax=Granulicella arctica TaxID=940613 RepID=A0A7Y9PGE4_9BACT|nr:hypothetical protein [Granulicella arctica]NYF79399.1 hypothetical protein [Granulicella arctica]